MGCQYALLLSWLSCIVYVSASHDQSCDVDISRTWPRANCTDRNLTSIPVTLSHSIMILELRKNSIMNLGTTLARYEELRILDLSCNVLEKLSAQNFRNLTMLRELYLNGNTLLNEIDHDVFVHLPELKVLNMACNRYLGFIPVMKSFENAPFVLDTLILDAVSKSEHLITITKQQFSVASLAHLQYLSLRYNHIFDIEPRVFLYLSPVRYLNFGHNFPIGIIKRDLIGIIPYIIDYLVSTNITSLDLSYMLTYLSYRLNYCKPCITTEVSAYFEMPRYPVDNITTIEPVGSREITYNHNTSMWKDDQRFLLAFIPPSLRFLHASNIVSSTKRRIYKKTIHLKANNLQYINISGSPLGGSTVMLYGLDNLEVFDASNCDISVIPDGFMTHFPKLRILLVSGNKIPNIYNHIKGLYKLEILDLSFNNIAHLPRNIFRGFRKLQMLDLSRNLLTEVDLVLSDLVRLTSLDLSANNIQSLGDDFLTELTVVANKTSFNLRLNNNPSMCTCDSISYIKWLQRMFSNESQIISDEKNLLACMYRDNTDYLIEDIQIDLLEEDCRKKVKFVENLLKTVLAPLLVILVVSGLVAVLCYRLRWQIWWEWHIIIRKKAGNDQQEFTHDIFIACEDSRKSGEFVTRLQENNTEYIHSSKDLDLNKSELEQNGQMMDISRRILFFVDDNFIDNLRQWEFLMPPVIESRRLDNIGLVIDTGLLETSLREYYPLWRLSKSTQCFGFYSGQDTNMNVWRDIAEFVRPVNDSYNDRLNEQDYPNMHDSGPLVSEM